MKLYKLTDKQGYTRKGESGETKWKKGFTLTKDPCENPQLCNPDVIHAYTNSNLAFLLNQNHANLEDPQLWEAQGKVVVKDWGKVGCFSLTTVKLLDTPLWTRECPQDVQIWFAILCAESVLEYFEDKCPNDDRPRRAIEAAKKYLTTKAARAAAYAAYAAAYAAYAAAYAAYAYASGAADAAYAHASAGAAEIDFGTLADKAVELALKKRDLL